jgi:hypothetical protein
MNEKSTTYLLIGGGILLLYLMTRPSVGVYSGGLTSGLFSGSNVNIPWYAQLGSGLGYLSGGIAKTIWGDSAETGGYNVPYTPGIEL